MGRVRIKRVYDPPAAEDGVRVLVDRLWPRGLTREAAGIELWLKEAAPSAALRRWFGHAPDRWDEFAKRYHTELEQNHETVAPLRGLMTGARPVTLLFAAKDAERNNAVVLRDFLAAS